jgi:3-methyladenine DNA glycosylase AlkD
MYSLRRLSNKEKAKNLSRFFKTGKGEYGEGDKFLGITVPQIRESVKLLKSKVTLTNILNLLRSEYHEERLCGLLLLIEVYKKGTKNDKEKIFETYLSNTKYINNWDLVDLTAPHIVGDFLQDKPKIILYRLAASKDLWERRIAIISTFKYIYDGKSAETIKIAKMLLKDEHDLIHKGVGWMLREVGKRCSEKILKDFLNKHYKKMPRTMLRYAIERLSAKDRKYYLHT